MQINPNRPKRKTKSFKSKIPYYFMLENTKRKMNDSHCISPSINNMYLYQSENSNYNSDQNAIVNVFNLISGKLQSKKLFSLK